MVDTISGLGWNEMTAELRRIWALEGVDVRWAGSDEEARSADVTLPIVFNDREVRKHDPSQHDAFGVTAFAGREQRIFVSIPRARELASMRNRRMESGDAVKLDITSGRVLGRVVAHEVGHALLLTTMHSPRGLMSAHIEPREVSLVGESPLALSLAERDRLAIRFATADAPERLAGASVAVAAAAGAARRPAAAPREAAAVEITWMDVPPVPSRLRAQR